MSPCVGVHAELATFAKLSAAKAAFGPLMVLQKQTDVCQPRTEAEPDCA